MRIIILAITALLVMLSAGCGSGNRPTQSATVTPVPIPGDYTGTFNSVQSSVGTQTGTVQLIVASDGTLSGTFDNTTLGQTGSVTGNLASNGAITVTTTYQSVIYTFSGTLVYVPVNGSTPDSLSGTLNVTSVSEESGNAKTPAVTELGTVQLQLTTATTY